MLNRNANASLLGPRGATSPSLRSSGDSCSSADSTRRLVKPLASAPQASDWKRPRHPRSSGLSDRRGGRLRFKKKNIFLVWKFFITGTICIITGTICNLILKNFTFFYPIYKLANYENEKLQFIAIFLLNCGNQILTKNCTQNFFPFFKFVGIF